MASIQFLIVITVHLLRHCIVNAAEVKHHHHIPVTFNYEAQTLQQVRTGCRGTLFPESKETHQVFYLVDATGTIKYVEPGSTVTVIFPFSTDGLVHHPHKRQTVRFTEICFPSQCKAPSCGRIIGPLTYDAPKAAPAGQGPFPAANWMIGGAMQQFSNMLNPGLYAGVLPQASMIPYKDVDGTADALETQSNAAGAMMQSIQANLENRLNGASTYASVQNLGTDEHPVIQAEASATSVVTPDKATRNPVLFHTVSTSTLTNVANLNSPPEPASLKSSPPLIHSSTVVTSTSNTISRVHNPSSFHATSTSTSTSDAEKSLAPEPSDPAKSTVPLKPLSLTVSTAEDKDSVKVQPQAPAVSSAEAKKPEAKPLLNTVELENPKPLEAPTAIVPVPPPITGTTVTTFTTQPDSNSVNCPASCPCCSNLQPTSMTIASSSLGSAPVVSSWPSWFPLPWTTPAKTFGQTGPSVLDKDHGPIRRDASYYASLPGAIRGSTHVIYYPSCERDAYYQPAIVNFCSYPDRDFTYGKITEQIIKN